MKKTDIAKYYFGPIDAAYDKISFSGTGTITLAGLMSIIYVDPSLAALEYVIDLLTISKV